MGHHYVEWLEKQHDHLIAQVREKEKLISEQIGKLTEKDIHIQNLENDLKVQNEQLQKKEEAISNLRGQMITPEISEEITELKKENCFLRAEVNYLERELEEELDSRCL